jgi:hypothetical protein
MFAMTLQAASLSESQDAPQYNAAYMASSYLPLERWVYPILESLAVEGFLQSAFFGLRPWIRVDCARLVEEAEDQTADAAVSFEVAILLRSLKKEFAVELLRPARGRSAEFRLEPLYQRVTSIFGTPLTDAYHIAETLVSDDGRPFAEGANVYSKLSFRTTAWPFAAYVKTEIGREVDGEQLWTTWQMSPRSSVELSGRSMTVNREFMQEASLRDLRVTADFSIHPEWQLHLEDQKDRWRFPLLSRNAECPTQLSCGPIGRAK